MSMTALSTYLLLQGDAARIPLPDRSVDLVFGSPPYVDCRTYLEDGKDLGIARGLNAWVEWMLAVTTEALRVSRGAVVWVASGKTEDRNYWPACEGLMWEWWKRGGHAYRPCYWHRVGIPGSGGDQWFRADVEYLMCFNRPGKLPWTDNVAMGHAPKWEAGGEISHRDKNGKRANNPVSMIDRNNVGSHRARRQAGDKYVPPEKSNPGSLVATGAAGGNNIGHDLAHESEAPFPEDLAEFFVRSLCPEGGTCLDPFSGSGTTASVSLRFGRQAIGMDLRSSQARIARQRIDRPHQPVQKKHKGDKPLPMFDGLEMP
jgi:hypothetical protein